MYCNKGVFKSGVFWKGASSENYYKIQPLLMICIDAIFVCTLRKIGFLRADENNTNQISFSLIGNISWEIK